MDLSPLNNAAVGNTANSDSVSQRNEAALRQAAAQFEAILLGQLTASLNPKEEDEEGLFTSGGGMGLSRQMFSEQIAKTMAESGGIGLADLILGQLGGKIGGGKDIRGGRALTAAREFRREFAKISSGEQKTAETIHEKAISAGSSIALESTADRPNPLLKLPESEPLSVAPASATRPRRVHEIARSALTSGTPALPETAATMAVAESSGPKLISRHVLLQLPLSGSIRSIFGPRRDPINGRQRFHRGIDIAAPRGTPIAAAAAGKVVFAGKNKGYGNMVMIEHADGRRTIYAHAEKLFVHAGAHVAAGQTIAAVGSTGHSTGPHVHFEVRENNRALNPLVALANDFRLARR